MVTGRTVDLLDLEDLDLEEDSAAAVSALLEEEVLDHLVGDSVLQAVEDLALDSAVEVVITPEVGLQAIKDYLLSLLLFQYALI